MKPYTILFFGSTTDSVIVLDALFLQPKLITICCVVTQPPKPIGREKIITPTPVQIWAQEHTIPFVSFASSGEKSWEYENEQTVIDTLQPFQADLILSASYGQKIPSKTIADARLGGLNIHPSLLPRWRGADPVPWAIIAGDNQIGVTIVTLTDAFDEGKLIAQKKIPITHRDTADPLRSTLFGIGADMLVQTVSQLKGEIFEGAIQNQEQSTYARKFTRNDGYIPWDLLQKAMNPELRIMNKELWKTVEKEYSTVKIVHDYLAHQPAFDNTADLGVIFERFFRALSPWPGMWTEIDILSVKKRLKILACHVSTDSYLSIDTVQLEGKNPTAFSQFASVYMSTT